MLLYRLLISLLTLVELGRSARGGADKIRARLGMVRPARSSDHIWLHGASNGELASARPMIAALQQARPDLHWLITSNTATGVEMVANWHLPQTMALQAPLDLRGANRRILNRFDVVMHIAVESELWPNRLDQCRSRNIPVAVIGARLTDRTAKSWQRFGGAVDRMMSGITVLSAQDFGTEQRFKDMGLPASANAPVLDLKSLYFPPTDVAVADSWRAAFPRHKTWLAASTHSGEDEIIIAAHKLALIDDPEIKLILAPRHPARADAIAVLLDDAGLSFARKSGGWDGKAADVLLADTMGEMASWYSMAGRVFIGGTLRDHGGHTPYEPAAFGAALMHGPFVSNFASAFASLDETGAAHRITSASELSSALIELSDASDQKRAGAKAQDALTADQSFDTVLDKIKQLLWLPKNAP